MSTVGMTSKEIWEELEWVSVDTQDCIEQPFYQFPVGTHREEIWRFLEDRDHTFSAAKEIGADNETTS